jgi:hypothetical protein
MKSFDNGGIVAYPLDRRGHQYGLDNPITDYNPYAFESTRAIMVDLGPPYRMNIHGDMFEREMVLDKFLEHLENVLMDNNITMNEVFAYCARKELANVGWDVQGNNFPLNDTIKYIKQIKEMMEEEHKRRESEKIEKFEEMRRARDKATRQKEEENRYLARVEVKYKIESLKLNREQLIELEDYMDKLEECL